MVSKDQVYVLNAEFESYVIKIGKVFSHNLEYTRFPYDKHVVMKLNKDFVKDNAVRVDNLVDAVRYGDTEQVSRLISNKFKQEKIEGHSLLSYADINGFQSIVYILGKYGYLY